MLGLADILAIVFAVIPFLAGWIMRGWHDELTDDSYKRDLSGKDLE